ncbi:zf-HC2 domain-containing protein [Nocardioides mangrovi]|uniref:Zf-HC2 domain-containing protein n=1 Tax=Nocardioides mangrovi TaxID=2874580 RepID=A0ABS7UHN6_9ACTN|nr:zf-HC2 domain-containing protein [Nocardioides mangrovi]MBZ5740112.1 zf-HC2 domain-containing protein [Nocardioides mangrovi]
MIGHLGNRVSALLDGQMSAEESERAWAHVHTCHACRDLVEREGWVKTRLAGLAFQGPPPAAPAGLKGSLMGACSGGSALTPGESYLAISHTTPRRRSVGLAVGGGAVGAAVMGVLALGAAPADAPTIDRRAPVTSITQPTVSQTAAPTPTRHGVGVDRSR